MDAPIASAVVLPEQDPESPPPTASSPTSLKRRQSSVFEQDAKRPRLNGDDASTDRRNSPNDSKISAPAPKVRERGRERRLFGAALGALSQNSATAVQKRRSEIEKRQQAQRKLEEEESEQRKLERQARRKAQRWKEQKQFETNSVRIRHDNLLAMAHFLQTTSEPRLYYKPWETTPDENDRIRDQIADAQEIIRRELEDHGSGQEDDAERERLASREGQADRNADAPVSGKGSNTDTPQQPDAANSGPTDGRDSVPRDQAQQDDHAEPLAKEAVSEERAADNASHSNATTHEATADEPSKEALDENGEEIVEAAEDTVIY
ncbi:hypothetical protein BU26DRAFT_486057 [Trematosphaeria pertusa]|uniref:Pinin/SDK/MemA protein domain-containing protein n=1 Tax=Trematosphaeria pertusa TaxID=390896 RepID=A0A6A6IFW2_9PLEO|nr:uncharacterized protein BU26DRAFT_486057 [Trematosphaeria pertusa]KAF2248420.1 hypothetical protein BU26DRAFT_486057 [Trematosphaeria pertusa]